MICVGNVRILECYLGKHFNTLTLWNSSTLTLTLTQLQHNTMIMTIYVGKREGPTVSVQHLPASPMRTELLPVDRAGDGAEVIHGVGLPSSSVLVIRHLRSLGSDIFAPVAFSCKIIRITSPGVASK